MDLTAKDYLFQAPNLVLAAAMYTLLARYILSLVFKADSQAVLWRVFCQITDPILSGVRVVTPAMVPGGVVMILAIFWTILLRTLLVLIAIQFGFFPKVTE